MSRTVRAFRSALVPRAPSGKLKCIHRGRHPTIPAGSSHRSDGYGMPDSSANTSPLLAHIARLRTGDSAALNELIRLAAERLETLTRRMLRDFPRVRRWAQTDDVLQNALVRLCRALQQVQPAGAREFYALATTQIRRELLDLARHYSGPE